MKIDINVDPALLLERMRNGEKRLAFAVVNAINRTARSIQDAERERMRQDFTLRRPDFILRQAAVIKPFASVGQGRPYAEIAVGQKSRLLLSEFETGGERKPFIGRRVAVPIIGHPARPAFPAPIAPGLMVRQLHLTKTRPLGPVPEHGRRRRSRKSGGQAIRFGAQGTYLIPSVGIFQRTGKRSSELIYAFLTEERLPKKLDFIETAEKIAGAQFRAFLEDEVERTLILNQTTREALSS